jgi:AcrR family transcriptional regulator
MAPEKYHHGNLRTQLLERAEVVIEEHGVDALSLRELARDCGVSHSAPRRHFADRQALLDALAVAGFEKLNGLLASVAEARKGYEERLLDVALAYVQFALDRPALLAVMFSAKQSAQSPDELRRLSSASLEIVTELFSGAQNEGLALGESPEDLAMAAFSAVQGAIALCAAGILPSDQLLRSVRVGIGLLWAAASLSY